MMAMMNRDKADASDAEDNDVMVKRPTVGPP
jgi:hypothetical protein